MALLDVFGIVFEGDASGVNDGLETAESSSDDLRKNLIDTDKAAGELGDSFLSLIGSAKGALASLLSLGIATTAVISTAAATDEVGKFSQTLGLNIEEVQAWSEAVVRSGGDANGFRSSIEGLTRGLTDFAVTGGGAAAETFNRLGISATDSSGKVKDAFAILPELADQFGRLTAAEATGFGQRLGLDQGTILLLQQGRQEVEALVARQKALGVATQEDYEIAALFNDTWADTKQLFRAVSITGGSTILPLLTDLLLGVQEFAFFLLDNKALIAGFFIGLAGTIITVYLPAIGAALTSTFALIAPFLAVGAAAIAIGAAIALVVDDIYNFIQGNDSLTGQIFENYPNIQKLIMQIGEAFGLLVEVAKQVGAVLLDVFSVVALGALNTLVGGIEFLLGMIDNVLGLANDVGVALSDAFNSPKQALDSLAEAFKTFVDNFFNLLPDLSGALSSVGGFFGLGGNEEVSNNVYLAQNAFKNADANPLNGQTTSSIINNQASRSTSVQINKVEVNTQATDAGGMASAAGGALSSEMQRAVNNIDDGVRI